MCDSIPLTFLSVVGKRPKRKKRGEKTQEIRISNGDKHQISLKMKEGDFQGGGGGLWIESIQRLNSNGHKISLLSDNSRNKKTKSENEWPYGPKTRGEFEK